jgi:hypothetical protein
MQRDLRQLRDLSYQIIELEARPGEYRGSINVHPRYQTKGIKSHLNYLINEALRVYSRINERTGEDPYTTLRRAGLSDKDARFVAELYHGF